MEWRIGDLTKSKSTVLVLHRAEYQRGHAAEMKMVGCGFKTKQGNNTSETKKCITDARIRPTITYASYLFM